MKRIAFLSLALLIALPSIAQAPAPAPSAPPAATSTGADITIKSETRLVQVDVVATDKAGNPIHGLQQSDFTILQDGVPQPVRFFDTHSLAEKATPNPTAAAARPKLPPNVFTNQPDAIPNNSWTIVLFDLLNTPTIDQQVARNQLAKLLKSLPSGQPVALYTLTSKLVLIQGFTTEPKEVLRAVLKMDILPPKLLLTDADSQHEIGDINNASVNSVGAPSGRGVDSGTSANVANFTNATSSRWMQGYNDMAAVHTTERVIFTLDALSAISRSVSGYPGRKNLLWLSGTFPIRIEPDSISADPFRNQQSFVRALDTAGALLAKSRVAVYPIDTRGLRTRGIDITTSTSESGAFTQQLGGDPVGATSVDRSANLLADQMTTSVNDRSTMVEIADQTGGRPFINTNDFGKAITRAIDDGTSYYTLAYTPPQKDDRATYHKIELRLNKPDTKLSYRRGYFSSPQTTNPAVGTGALQAALQPGMPPSTTLLFTTRLQPPDATRKTVRLDYIVSPGNLVFTDMPNGAKHILVDCMAIAFDKEGKEAAHASNTLEATIPATTYNMVMSRGLPANQELTLPPGTYTVRVGVMDRNSQQIGTIDLPLTVQ